MRLPEWRFARLDSAAAHRVALAWIDRALARLPEDVWPLGSLRDDLLMAEIGVMSADGIDGLRLYAESTRRSFESAALAMPEGWRPGCPRSYAFAAASVASALAAAWNIVEQDRPALIYHHLSTMSQSCASVAGWMAYGSDAVDDDESAELAQQIDDIERIRGAVAAA